MRRDFAVGGRSLSQDRGPGISEPEGLLHGDRSLDEGVLASTQRHRHDNVAIAEAMRNVPDDMLADPEDPFHLELD